MAGACASLDQESWRFTFCAGSFIRQNTIPNLVKQGTPFESFSLGQFNQLDTETAMKLKSHLEGKDLLVNAVTLNKKSDDQKQAEEKLQ